MATYIHSVSLICGDFEQTSDVFVAWLTSALKLGEASHVRADLSTEVGRDDALKSALFGELGAWDRQCEWTKRTPAISELKPGERLAVWALSATQDLGVALLFSKDPGPAELIAKPDGETVVFPDIEDAILPAFSLTLAFLAAKHGWLPGHLQPIELSGEPRRVRAGDVSVAALEEPAPLRLTRPQIVETSADSVERLSGRVVLRAVSGLGEPTLREVVEEIQNHRTFSERFVYSAEPLEGQVAFLYPGPFNHYPGAGSGLVALRKRAPEPGVVQRTAWIQAENERILKRSGVIPDVFIGQSVSQAWIGKERAASTLAASPLLTQELGGEFTSVRESLAARGFVDEATNNLKWQAWLVLGPLDMIREIIRQEPLLEIAQIHTDHECVVVGPEASFDRALVEILNSARMHAAELGWSSALHTSHAEGRGYMGFDLSEVDDMRPRVLEAWESGVRLFVDLGPRSWFAGWVGRILEGKPHVASSMDNPMAWSTTSALRALIGLSAHGVPVDFDYVLSLFKGVDKPLVALPPRKAGRTQHELVFGIAHAILEEQSAATRVHLQYIADQTAAFEKYLELSNQGLRTPERKGV